MKMGGAEMPLLFFGKEFRRTTSNYCFEFSK